MCVSSSPVPFSLRFHNITLPLTSSHVTTTNRGHIGDFKSMVYVWYCGGTFLGPGVLSDINVDVIIYRRIVIMIYAVIGWIREGRRYDTVVTYITILWCILLLSCHRDSYYASYIVQRYCNLQLGIGSDIRTRSRHWRWCFFLYSEWSVWRKTPIILKRDSSALFKKPLQNEDINQISDEYFIIVFNVLI